MKKAEAMNALPMLYSLWEDARDKSTFPPGEISSDEFFIWISNNYPRYLNFRTNIGVPAEIEYWYDKETHQTWKN